MIYSPIIFCIELKIFRADGRSHFPVNGVRDRGLRGDDGSCGGEKKNVNELEGAEGKAGSRDVNPEKNRTETSISSSCHFLSLSFFRVISREYFFFSKLSLEWIRIDWNVWAENDRSRTTKYLRAATKTFRAEGGFRVAETVARFSRNGSRCVSNLEKVATRSRVNRIGAKFLRYFYGIFSVFLCFRVCARINSKIETRIDVEDRFLLLSRN